MLLDNGEPSNYEEAMAGPDSNKWLEAMKSEIGSMYENEVWTLTDLPDDRRATNYEEAMASPDSDKWLDAMKSEI